MQEKDNTAELETYTTCEGSLVSFSFDTGFGQIFSEGKKHYFSLENFAGDASLLSENTKIYFDYNASSKKVIEVRLERDKTDDSLLKDAELDNEIDDYFQEAQEVVALFEAYINESKSLDYRQMKRFLFTAFNNLKEHDYKFAEGELNSLINKVLFLDEEYKKFRYGIERPLAVIFENIFLEKQALYLQLTDEIDSLKQELRSAKTELLHVEENLRKLENIHAKGLYTLEETQQLKHARSKHVDLVEKIDIFSKKVQKRIIIHQKFREINFHYFREKFLTLRDKLDKLMLAELNSLAFLMDVMLWDKAKNSSHILEFLRRSKISGLYNTKNFLDYYLKQLDHERLSKSNAELLKLKKFLDNVIKVRIVLYSQHEELAKTLQEVFKQVDETGIDLVHQSSKTALLNWVGMNETQIILIDPHLPLFRQNIENFALIIDEISRASKEKNISFILLYQNLTKKQIYLYRKLGFKTFLHYPNQEIDKHYIETIRRIF